MIEIEALGSPEDPEGSKGGLPWDPRPGTWGPLGLGNPWALGALGPWEPIGLWGQICFWGPLGLGEPIGPWGPGSWARILNIRVNINNIKVNINNIINNVFYSE